MGTIITNKVRFCYAHVFEPYARNETDKKQYSVCILIPKSDKRVGSKLTTYEKCMAAIKEALEDGKSKKFGGKIPLDYDNPIHDGDVKRPDDPAYKGMWFVNARTTVKPEIRDADNEAIMSNSEFYSGVWGRASISFYPFNVSGHKGVACGLRNLQTYNEGENLVGGSSAEKDFEDTDDLM